MLEDIIKKLRKNINEKKEKNNDILNFPRTINDNNNFLSILKKWNSVSPKYPLNRSKDYINFHKYDYKAGGGFFLVLDGYGLIIDPGYNFLESFYENGFVPRDIDGIFISHCHDDHCIDLESIFSVIFKINEENPIDKKKIDLYVNPITYDKYSSLWSSLPNVRTKICLRFLNSSIIFLIASLSLSPKILFETETSIKFPLVKLPE